MNATERVTAPSEFNRGSARMFKSDFLEWFSHVHPVTPLIFFTPIVIASAVVSVTIYGNSGSALLWQIPLGYFVWTLTEYWLHRLVFHLPVRGQITKKIYFYAHGVHHDWPWDQSRLVMPPGASITLALLFYGLYRLVFPADLAHSLFAGFIFGYLSYDMLHWYSHAGTPKNRWLKYLRREHMVHHFKENNTRFGVSCPWWDYVFRTRGQ
jgi:sterol desaturase/sphingolipid hydroxylase (fatty acid hydroxylase superfamily)